MRSAFMFLVWSNEHRKWWRPDRNGYTSFIEEAGRYTEQEAAGICAQANVTPLDVRRDPLTGVEHIIASETRVLAPESWAVIEQGAAEIGGLLGRTLGMVDLGGAPDGR